MTRRALPVAALLVLAGLTSVARADDMANMPGMAKAPDGADAAMTAGMSKMQHDMAAAPMTGDADRDFVAMMLPHHQGAVDMAQAELRYGHDPMLRKLAQDIVAAQQKEIAGMRKWQAAHPGK